MPAFPHFEIASTSPHRYEIEALERLGAALPSYSPFGGLALFSFESDDGRRYTIDALAMTAQHVLVFAIKTWSGEVIAGDERHLVLSSKEGAREVVDHPLPLLAVKASALEDRVKRVARQLGPEVYDKLAHVRFEPIVWLSHVSPIALGEHDRARACVIGPQEIADAIRQGRFPGAGAEGDAPLNTHETRKALRRVLASPELGRGTIDRRPTVLDGRFELGEQVEEGPDYQDHWAVPSDGGPRCRVRSYLAPRSDRAFVERLERRVAREAEVLQRLGDHADILALRGLDLRGPLGPALVFHGFAGKALDAFLKERGAPLALDEKLAILRRVADALGFCHRADLIHGAISPEAVLVQQAGDHLEVKLTRFAIAASSDPTSEGTRLFTRLAGASANLYEAPEVARGGAPTQASDLFSFGALAYFLLAERPPATSAAELAQRLDRDRGLVISAVRDDLFPKLAGDSKGLDETLKNATSLDPAVRVMAAVSPLDLVEEIELALTDPEAPPEPLARREQNPLEAAKGDVLGGDLRVVSVLGSGATARVLKVARDDGDYALKVPLSDAHNKRIVEEGEVLARLNRTAGIDRVARLVEVRTIEGRPCLLLQLAGDRTLADKIRSDGAPSLDQARRWGDDLLTAIRGLEGAGVQHRDIKPANIGVTAQSRLLIFDFSLAPRPATDIGMGTPAYKDPDLVARGRWDDAADRWAAAITLHEMFTGVRPAPVPGASGSEPAVRVDADRFDADVRDGLSRFFMTCFRKSARDRFATADDMRDAFIQALHKVPAQETAEADEPVVADADLKGLGPEARVDLLPLSTRGRNALDRMGVYTLHELAGLSTNRIGGVRGVGAKTARALIALAERVRRHLEVSASDAPPPFHRGFAGARVPVEEGLGALLAYRFSDAGLASSVAVAAAPEKQIKNLLARARKDGAEEKLADITAWLDKLVDAERAPTTLGAAVELIAPSRGRGGASLRRVREYLGLHDVEGFPRFGSMQELAKAQDKTRALISLDIGKARERWLGEGQVEMGSARALKTRERIVLEAVYRAVDEALAASAGVIPMARAASAVARVLPPEPDLGADAVTRAAEALIRAVTEIDAPLLGGAAGARLRIHRARADHVLLARGRDPIAVAEMLGKAADALVEGDRVSAEPAAAAHLREALAADRDLSPRAAEQARALPDRALVALAAATADRARVSVRGELYPAGLPADRAVKLSAAAISRGIERDELSRRVRARYPESADFPADPAFFEALAPSLGLRFDAPSGALVTRDRTLPHASTELGSVRSHAPAEAAPSTPSATPDWANKPRAEGDIAGASASRVFDEEIDRARREGAFRVLLWRGRRATQGRTLSAGAPDAEYIAKAVARRLQGEVRRADALLIDAASGVAAAKNLKGGLAPALAADARGPEGPAWPRLVELMRLAAADTVNAILASARPTVLVRIGLLARYDLLSSIGDLAAAHRDGVARPATLIVLPVYVGESAVVEVGADVAVRGGALVPLPGVLPHEILDVPSAWADRQEERHGSGTFTAVRG